MVVAAAAMRFGCVAVCMGPMTVAIMSMVVAAAAVRLGCVAVCMRLMGMALVCTAGMLMFSVLFYCFFLLNFSFSHNLPPSQIYII